MVNIEALLSPTGGYNYDETINTGMAGLVGAFLFDKRFHMGIEKHARSYFRRGTAEYKDYTKAVTKAKASYQNALKGIETIDIKGADKYTDIRKKKADAIRRARKVARTDVKGATLKYEKRSRVAERAFAKNLKSSRALFRGIGITMLLSAGFDIMEAVSTPGISKVAAQKEQQFMANTGTALDSQGSYTMRQRAVMAIHDSMMNVRQVIGNEAQFMHR